MVLRSRWLINKKEVVAKNGVVTTAISEAAEAGLKMLKRGGNAIDAGVAAGFCNTVLEPYMAALGGLGFMLIYLAEEDKTVAIDFNARAPQKATPDMYKVIGPAAAGGTRIFEVENSENSMSAKAISVPTTCAGFCLAHELYGKLPREDVIAPAIHLAAEGFEASWDAALYLARIMSEVRRNPAIDDIWYPGGYPLVSGMRVVQPDFGRLLKRIAREGPDAVYRGEVAAAIEREVQKEGGILTREDLERYEPTVSEPLTVSYRDYTIAAVPTPSGGITALETFNILENFDLEPMGHNTAEYIHTFVECTRHAFADRFRFLGDWEHANVPLEGFLSKGYAKECSDLVDPEKAAMEPELSQEPWIHYLDRAIHDPWRFDPQPRPKTLPGPATASSEEGTTHFNVVDKERNVVSCTHTPGFRTGIVPPGTGFYLTPGMGWFIPKPGYANSVAGWKRPVLNMAPLMVLRDGVPVVSQGSPGARRIINRNTQVVLNVIEFGLGIQDAIDAPIVDASGRETLVDSRLPSDVVDELRGMKHRVKVVEEGPGVWHFARPSGIVIDHEEGLLHGGVDIFRPAVAMGY
ncbi:MAG: gamma-glutamyltransferase [Candidatus Bathyarchaeota archaeon]|nr:gamma-glutamyltransferase [Candidatus Bathyarchaeota archaeon]